MRSSSSLGTCTHSDMLMARTSRGCGGDEVVYDDPPRALLARRGLPGTGMVVVHVDLDGAVIVRPGPDGWPEGEVRHHAAAEALYLAHRVVERVTRQVVAGHRRRLREQIDVLTPRHRRAGTLEIVLVA